MKMNRKLLILIGISIVSILGALGILIVLTNSTASTTQGKSGLVSVTVDNKTSSSKTYKLEAKEGEVLLDTLKRLEGIDDSFTFAFQQDPTLGAYITSISSYAPDTTKNEFWKLVINGADASEGVSVYKVKADDTILFEIDNY